MSRNFLIYTVLILIFCTISGCREKKAPLNKEQFTALLIDIHRVDGTLAVGRGLRGNDEMKNYAYYNDLFKKYGITRADFDSCMYFYSAQTVMFSKMYDVVIDSLNKQLTAVDKVLNELKANDSVNYFPTMIDTIALDTIRLDSVVTVCVDSIVPGLYKFNTTLQFDSVYPSRTRRISSFFVSGDGKDTLRVRDITVSPDTIQRNYNWSQYADSVYSRLVIRFMEKIPEKERPKTYKNGKVVKPDKKEKEINLEDFGGKAWNNQLFRPYVSRETENRLKQSIRRR